MAYVIITLSLIWFAYLLVEKRRARANRREIKHVIHVNGIRGKTSVTRMIASGLNAGGCKVMCKTTGTIPSHIMPDGSEHEIKRRGRANIKEQLFVLGLAAKAGVDVLVVECMALDPEYQRTSQHQMLQADIGVITNIRMDHEDVFGHSLSNIAEALSNTTPKRGVLFTAEQRHFEQLQANAQRLGSGVVQSAPDQSINYGVEFAENGALALAVCEHLGVGRADALRGIANYRRDKYALAAYNMPGGSLFINGMSINDAQSIEYVYEMLHEKGLLDNRRFTLLINNRADRPERAAQMAELAARLKPQAIWLTGSGNGLFIRVYKKQPDTSREADTTLPDPAVKPELYSAAELPFGELDENDMVLAIGNIAGPGLDITDRAEREGCAIVL